MECAEVISHLVATSALYHRSRALSRGFAKKAESTRGKGIFTSSAPPFAVAPRIRLKVSAGAPSKMCLLLKAWAARSEIQFRRLVSLSARGSRIKAVVAKLPKAAPPKLSAAQPFSKSGHFA